MGTRNATRGISRSSDEDYLQKYLNPDGTITLYHATDELSAKRIQKDGELRGEGNEVYLSTSPRVSESYGETVVRLTVDPKILQLDDEFPDGRLDFRVEGNLKPIRIDGVTRFGELPRELHRIMFEEIGTNAGFGCETEYEVGIARICEAAHCVFGSAVRSTDGRPFGDFGHMDEEMEILNHCIKAYQVPHPNYEPDLSVFPNAERAFTLTEKVHRMLRDNAEEIIAEIGGNNFNMAVLSNLVINRITYRIIADSETKPFKETEETVQRLSDYYKQEQNRLKGNRSSTITRGWELSDARTFAENPEARFLLERHWGEIEEAAEKAFRNTRRKTFIIDFQGGKKHGRKYITLYRSGVILEGKYYFDWRTNKVEYVKADAKITANGLELGHGNKKR